MFHKPRCNADVDGQYKSQPETNNSILACPQVLSFLSPHPINPLISSLPLTVFHVGKLCYLPDQLTL